MVGTQFPWGATTVPTQTNALSTTPYNIPPRVALLIPSLGRDNDNEVVATVRAIGAALEAGGLDFHDLAQAIAGAGRLSVECATSSTTHPQNRGSASWAPGHRAWQAHSDHDRARWLAMYGAASLSDREQDFVDGLLQQLSRRGARASERQAAWLAQIFARVSRAAA